MSEFLAQLRERTPQLRARWEALLRVEPVNGPLAHPDALVHLIPDTLDRFFAALARPSRAPLSLQAARARLPKCNCGHNPYLAYFVAGEQAILETIVLLQAEQLPSLRRQSDLARAILVIRRLARGEIDTFCDICSHRLKDPKCRHLPAAV